MVPTAGLMRVKIMNKFFNHILPIFHLKIEMPELKCRDIRKWIWKNIYLAFTKFPTPFTSKHTTLKLLRPVLIPSPIRKRGKKKYAPHRRPRFIKVEIKGGR